MRYARVKSGKVVEILVVDESRVAVDKQYSPQFVAELVRTDDENVQEDWQYDGDAFSTPLKPELPPKRVLDIIEVNSKLGEWLYDGLTFTEIQTEVQKIKDRPEDTRT